MEAQEFDKLSKAIHDTCPDARVTGYGGSINGRGQQTHKVTFIVNKLVDPMWVESTFGKMFAKGLISIDSNSGMGISNGFGGGQVIEQLGPASSTVTVEIKHIGFALYEINQKLAWKHASEEFTVLMDDLLQK